MTTTKTPMRIDHGLELAGDLIRALTPLSGDREAVNAELNHWLTVLDADDLSLVCTAAVRTIFADCLTPTPIDQLPADRLALVPTLTNERKTA